MASYTSNFFKFFFPVYFWSPFLFYRSTFPFFLIRILISEKFFSSNIYLSTYMLLLFTSFFLKLFIFISFRSCFTFFFQLSYFFFATYYNSKFHWGKDFATIRKKKKNISINIFFYFIFLSVKTNKNSLHTRKVKKAFWVRSL